MTIDSFYNSWIGKVVDFDRVNRFQCVDLIKQYIFEKYNIPNASRGRAVDWWYRTGSDLLKYFDKIETQQPERGDIVVLRGLSGNSDGHIVIALSRAQNNMFLSFEQNGATGDGDGKGGDEIRKRLIPTTRILGVLRDKPKSSTSLPQYYTIKKGDTFYALERAWGMPAGQLQKLNPTLNPRLLQIGQRIRKS